jgi:hypothetical protein
MRKTAKSALSPTIAYKRDTGVSGAVSSVSVNNRNTHTYNERNHAGAQSNSCSLRRFGNQEGP